MKKSKNKKSVEKNIGNTPKMARSEGTQKPSKLTSGGGPRRPTSKYA